MLRVTGQGSRLEQQGGVGGRVYRLQTGDGIEVSGIGILREPFAASARLGLVVDLVDPAGIERLPEPRTAKILGQAIRRVELPAREAGFGADILASLVLSPPVNDV